MRRGGWRVRPFEPATYPLSGFPVPTYVKKTISSDFVFLFSFVAIRALLGAPFVRPLGARLCAVSLGGGSGFFSILSKKSGPSGRKLVFADPWPIDLNLPVTPCYGFAASEGKNGNGRRENKTFRDSAMYLGLYNLSGNEKQTWLFYLPSGIKMVLIETA